MKVFYGKWIGLCLFVFVTVAFLPFSSFAAIEIGDNYVMFDMCEYDGNSTLPYGKGSNGNCYYPKNDDAEYMFPEIYTWTASILEETSDGVRLYARNIGTNTSMTIDKMPVMYKQSIQNNLHYILLRIKADTVGENTVSFTSLNGSYRKICNVNYTGDWQTVVIDLSGSEGWFKKNNDGTYSETTATPWDSRYIGTDGFTVAYTSFGQNVKNSVYIKYYAFTDDSSLLLNAGHVKTMYPYVKGGTDGLFRPLDKLTRLECAIITCRAMGFEDEEIKVLDGYSCRFSDVPKENYGYKYVAFLDSIGALTRYGDSFSPDSFVTVSELSAMLINAKVCTDADTSTVYWNFKDGTRVITRAEACSLINGITGRCLDFEIDSELFSDVSQNHTFGKDIYAAALTAEVKTLNDGTKTVLSVYKTPDYELTSTVIKEIDEKATELYNSIKNSKTEITPSEKCYYISPNGNDSNSGTSKDYPWKTLKKVNSVGFSAGSTVFFERGGLWRGSLNIRPSVTYSAYGEGEKPTFYGSMYDGADGELWSLVEGTDNVWKFKYDMLDCGSVVFNHGEHHSYKEIPSYNGNEYLHRNSSKVFNYKTDIGKNLGIFCDNKKNLTAECPLYLRCDEGNPGELFDSIEFLPRQNVLYVTANKNAVIDNFKIMYGGAHGIGAGTISGLKVQNCEFYWIGGSIQNYSAGGGTMAVRYGNAVESYGAQNGYYVENNYIHQVYDAGITHQMAGGTQENGIQKNIRYANNLIEFCSYSVEYFLGDGAEGTPDRYMENVVIENNIMRYAGFGFGNQRTDRLCMSHIKSGSHRNAVSEGFVIRNNVFDRSREMLIYIVAKNAEDLPSFEDNTYIQYLTSAESPNATLGYYGENPARLRFYTPDAEHLMRRIGLENNPKTYFVKKDWLFELPEY